MQQPISTQTPTFGASQHSDQQREPSLARPHISSSAAAHSQSHTTGPAGDAGGAGGAGGSVPPLRRMQHAAQQREPSPWSHACRPRVAQLQSHVDTSNGGAGGDGAHSPDAVHSPQLMGQCLISLLRWTSVVELSAHLVAASSGQSGGWRPNFECSVLSLHAAITMALCAAVRPTAGCHWLPSTSN